MKIAILSSVLAAAFAAAPAFAANNLDTNWGDHGVEQAAIISKTGFGQFVDTFSFSLSSASNLTATLFSSIADPSKGNFSGQFRLFSGLADDGVQDVQIGSMFQFNKNAPVLEEMTFTNLLPGNYFYELHGELSKVGGNKFYALDSLATPSAGIPPVPEPETYAMLLAGLGVVGMAVRRRAQ